MKIKNRILKMQQYKTELISVLLTIILIFTILLLKAQTSNSDFERINLGTGEIEYSGISVSPDKNTIAISTKNDAPVFIFDWKNKKVIHEFNAGNWNSGSRIFYSEKGKYLLLQELGNRDYSLNQPREIAFEIIDASNGNHIRKFENVQDVLISSDEQFAVCLAGEYVQFINLASGSEVKKIAVPGAVNAIALSPDGKLLAVAEKISGDYLKNNFRGDKKGAKLAEKTRQLVSFYDVETGSKLRTVTELYEIIFKLRFTPDGEFIIVSQTPEISTQVANKKISYFNMIDVATAEPVRRGFTSMSINQPALHFSADRKYFAINSKGQKFQEIHLYDSETATLQKRFELGKRIFEKVDGEKIFGDSRPSFAFLPDEQAILIAMGNQFLVWNFEIDE